MTKFKIGNVEVGGDNPIAVIAEISCSHNQNIDNAKKLIEKAKWAGANIIKTQIYEPRDMTIDCFKSYFRIDNNTPWDGKYLFDLYLDSYTPYKWFPELKKFADYIEIPIFSSAFSEEGFDYLVEHGAPCLKLASFEIAHLPLIRHIAKKQLPIIFSTGIAEPSDITNAMNVCISERNYNLAFLKCSSTYPSPPEETNLNAIKELQRWVGRFMVGLSDHTRDIFTAVAAATMNEVKIIEKHIKLDDDSLDAAFSLTPKEFKRMVEGIREVEAAMGSYDLELTEKQKKARKLGRSIFVVEDIKKGEKFTEKNIGVIRPGMGLHPKYYEKILGRIASEDLERGEPLKKENVVR